MADELGWVGLGVAPDLTGFKDKLERDSSKAMGSAGATGGRAFGAAASDSAGARFKAGMKNAAKAGALALAGVGVAAFKFAGDSLEEARESQKIGAQTEAVIKSTGKAARVSADDVGRLSGRLSDMAGVDDEIIQNGANVLLTFTKVRNEAGKSNKIFDRGAKAALNMSTALGTDLRGASIQVGKALNDPIKGATALARAGVQFTTVQKAQIKALVEGGDVNASLAMGLVDSTTTFNNLLKAQNGDVAKTVDLLTQDLSPAQKKMYDLYAEGGHTLLAQKRILKELDTQFAGSAKAQATSADKLNVAWGNFKEEIGTQLIPVMDDLAAFLRKKGIPAAKDFFGWVKDEGVPALKDFKDQVTPVAEQVKDLVGYLNDLPKSVKIGGLAGILALVGGAKLRGSSGGALGTAGKVLGITKPVPVFVTNPAFGGGAGVPGAGKPGVPPGAKPKGLSGNVKGALSWLTAIPLPALGAVGADTLPPLMSEDEVKRWERLHGEVKGVKTDMERLDTTGKRLGPYRVGIESNVQTVLNFARQYEGVLEGIPREVRTTFVQSVVRNNVVEDVSGRGGKTPATAPSGVQVNIERVMPYDSREFFQDMQRRSGAAALSGRRP